MPSNSAWRKPSSNCARCAPNANAATKALLLASESGELGALLDDAARQFAEAVGGAEGSEGTLAFVQKRKPVWAQ